MIKAAVIVLTYNALHDSTAPCLESIFRTKTDIGFQLVIVDNNSTDGTREYLQLLTQQHGNVQTILNDSNLGYAAGNNIGIKTVDAEYYVLLNSDTIVTDYWLDGLIGFLQSHPDVGMVGPVSNSVGNEQIISVNSASEPAIIDEGIEWSKHCKGDYFFTEMLGFFCVAIKKNVFDTVGLLDESFGIGMFEDNDFCLRVRQAGFKLACVEEVFVYHKGSISFKNAMMGNVNELIYTNKKLFEAKHSVKWQPQLSAPKIIDLIGTYVANSKNDPIKTLYKVDNKLKVLRRFDYSAQSVSADELADKLAAVYTSLTWRVGSSLLRALMKVPLSGFVYQVITGKKLQDNISRWD